MTKGVDCLPLISAGNLWLLSFFYRIHYMPMPEISPISFETAYSNDFGVSLLTCHDAKRYSDAGGPASYRHEL